MSKTRSNPDSDTYVGVGALFAVLLLVILSLVVNIISLLKAYGPVDPDPRLAPIDTAVVQQAIQLIGEIPINPPQNDILELD